MQTDIEFTRERRLPSLYSESIGEYSLPDYNTDVKKLLLVRARPVPSGRFLDGDALKFSGIVSYDVVYVDSEDDITHCEFTTDYDFKVKCDSEIYVDSDVTTTLLGVNVRLLGPRKFSVKSSLHSDARIIERDTLAVAGDGMEGDSIELAKGEAKVCTAVFSENCEREYAEELATLEGVIEDDVEVLICECEPRINSVSLTDGGVEYRGELHFEALVKVENGYPTTYEKTIPVTEKIDFADAEESVSPEVNISCVSVSTSTVADEGGVKINLAVITDARASGYKNEKINPVCDSFLKDREVINEYREFKYSQLLCRESGSDSFTYEMPKGEGEGNIRNVLVTVVNAKLEETEVTSEGLILKGSLRFSGIGCQISDDGEAEYVSLKYDVPFEQNVNVSCQICDKMKTDVRISASGGYIESDPVKTYFGCKLTWDVGVYEEKELECLCSSTLTDTVFNRDDSAIVVYYPSEKESLFDVAKKFHTSVLSIAENNALTDSAFASAQASDSLAGVKRLIIKG